MACDTERASKRFRRCSRAPASGPRALARARRRAGVRLEIHADGFRRVTRRVPVPEEVIAMVRLGLAHPAAVGRGWWRRVEDRVGAFVRARLPAGARGVRLELDADRLEVRLVYALPRASRGRSIPRPGADPTIDVTAPDMPPPDTVPDPSFPPEVIP